MRIQFFRRTPVLITAASVTMLVVGLAIGLLLGGAGRPAHAAGINGAIDIFPDGSLTACTPTLGCTSHPAGTCAEEGNSTAFACSFQLSPHDGGAIEQNGVAECFLIQPSGSYFTTFDSHVVYAPSGEVHVRCVP